jgi:hypothetical protein
VTMRARSRSILFHQSKVGDQHVYAGRSRFIPDVILDSFDAHSLARTGGKRILERRFSLLLPSISIEQELIGLCV